MRTKNSRKVKKAGQNEKNEKIKNDLSNLKNARHGNEIKDTLIDIFCLLMDIDPESI